MTMTFLKKSSVVCLLKAIARLAVVLYDTSKFSAVMHFVLIYLNLIFWFMFTQSKNSFSDYHLP